MYIFDSISFQDGTWDVMPFKRSHVIYNETEPKSIHFETLAKVYLVNYKYIHIVFNHRAIQNILIIQTQKYLLKLF